MSIIKRSILVVFVAIILLTSFIFPASAFTADFYFNVPDPSTISDGYIIIPHSGSSGAHAIMYWWTVTPSLIDVSSSGSLMTTVDYRSTDFTITFNKSVSATSVAYHVTLYGIYHGLNSTPFVVDSAYVSNGSNFTYTRRDLAPYLNPTAWSGIDDLNLYTNDSMGSNSFTYRFADNNAFYNELVDINNNLSSLIQNSSLSSEAIQTLIDNTYSILNKLTSIDNNSSVTNDKLTTTVTSLNTIITHFVSLLDKVDYTNEQLDEIVLKFSELLEVSYSIQSSLDDFIYVYFDTFMYQTFPDNMTAIISRLDALLRQLNKSGDSEQTTVDTSNIDNYVDIEQSLVNNDEAESAINDFDVSISGKAYSFIWDLITRIFNSHPEVFGLVIAILTLGFIALLLNR